MSTRVLVIDVGTSRLKVALTDMDGRVVSSRGRSVVYETPEGPASLARSIAPGWLWRAVTQETRRALGAAAPRAAAGAEVAAVAITTQRQAVVFLDVRRQPLYVGPNLDLRAVFQGAAIDDAHADAVYRATGHLPSFLFTPAKLLWHQLVRPDVYERVATVCTLGDWLGYRLTGVLAAEPTAAGEAGLLDLESGGWATALMDRLGLRGDLFPPLAPPGRAVGGVVGAAARATGLPQGTPVVLAGPDTQCGLVGLGVTEPGEIGVVAGWSTTVQTPTAAPVLDAGRRTWAGRHVVGGRWVAEANAGDGGNAYRWLRDLCFPPGARGFSAMEAAAEAVPAGAEETVAMLGPAPLDLSRPGLRRGGVLFPVPVAFSGVGRGHLARAVLENLAFAVRGLRERLHEVVPGLREDERGVVVGGGMTRTGLFVRILAGVLGCPVVVSAEPDVSVTGAALVAAASLPGSPPLPELARRRRAGAMLSTVAPDPSDAEEYGEHYERWRSTTAGMG